MALTAGTRLYDAVNDLPMEVVERDGDRVRVEDANGTAWWETVGALQYKLLSGDHRVIDDADAGAGAKLTQHADPMANGHDLDPGTGTGTCSETGESFEAETWAELDRDCPHCGDRLIAVPVDAETNSEVSAAAWEVQTPTWDGRSDSSQGQEGGLDLEDVDADDPSDPTYRDKHLAVDTPVETTDDVKLPVVNANANLDLGDLQDAWRTAARTDGPDTEAVKAEIHALVTEHFPDSELAERTRAWAEPNTAMSDASTPDRVVQAADIPLPSEAQLLYPEEPLAETVATQLGLQGAHAHTLDGEEWWMPGETHAAFTSVMVNAADPLAQQAVGDDEWSAETRVFRVVPAEGERDEYDDDVLGVGVSFPESGVYVDWHTAAFPDELADPHVSEYGSVADLRKATGNDVVDMMPPQNGEAVSTEAVDTKAEFAEGDAVTWTWDGEPVHGRVAEGPQEQATVSGNTITGEEGENVYIIDEYDDDVEAYRRENVAKPESSLNESQKDLPPRTEENYAAADVLADIFTTVHESAFTVRELDYITHDLNGVLRSPRPNEWAFADGSLAYRAVIPEKYLAERDEDFFVPNESVADAARKVEEWEAEHGDDVAGGASDGEGSRRRTQLIEYAERGEPLAIEYWEEIANYHNRHHPQGNHELDADAEGEPWTDAGYVSHLNWGGDAGYEQAQRVMDVVDEVDSEAEVTLRGAVGATRSVDPRTITEADTNKVDLDALDGDLREAVEADDFYIYGKASIEQWDDDDPPTYIQMDALETALDRFFTSETAPGIISRHHQDIPVGVPVESFEFSKPTTLEIDGETYQFSEGETARSHVEDADGDGRPELWLAANISNDNEMAKKTRILAAQNDLTGFSVTVHRNDDEVTSEGRYVTECDLHAVTIGTDEQIKNPGSEFDVASIGGKLRRVKDRVTAALS